MKTLYIECNMGAAGDMLMGALLEIYGDREKFTGMMNGIGIDGVKVSVEDNFKCGIKGTKVHVCVDGEEEHEHHDHAHHHEHDHDNHDHDHEHHHEHEHDHHHDHEHSHEQHHHASYKNILSMIDSYNIPDKVKEDAKAIYKIIGDAEAYAHNTDIENIHFHEVGTLDAVADVIGNCLLMNLIAPEKVVVSPINTGSGTVRCAHGILPVPAPATAKILQGIPIYAGSIKSELCTPTGAAILKYYADEFSKMPVMVCEKTGYGMGTKDFEEANCVRVFFGDTEDKSEKVVSIQCNLDDMTGEAVAYACDVLFENGALDVFTMPVYMKKNRPGILLVCICDTQKKDEMLNIILKETTTRGVRFCEMDRRVMDYEFFGVDTEFGEIKVKKSSGFGVEKYKSEFESVKEAAKKHGVKLSEVYDSVIENLKQGR